MSLKPVGTITLVALLPANVDSLIISTKIDLVRNSP